MALRSIQLREKRAKLVNDAQTFFHAIEAPTAEDNAKFDAMIAESDTLMAQITRLETAEASARELAVQIAADPAVQAQTDMPADPKERLALDKNFMTAMLRVRSGVELSAPDKALVQRYHDTAMSTGTQGADVIAPLFQRELLIALKAFGGMREVSRNIVTATGAALPWPTMDDTAHSASIVSENSSRSEDTELTFGNVTIGAFMYSSGPLLISLELLQDSAFDFDSLIKDALTIRFGRKQNSDFTIGAGTTLPFGAVTQAASGKVGASGQTATVIYDDLVDLFHSVDPAYRANGKFMMCDSTMQAVRKLKDGDSRPLWQPNLQLAEPDSLLGVPVVINQQIPTLATSHKSILFGDFSNYLIRDTLQMTWMVLKERYAEYAQVGYIALMRSDGNLISAASPIKYYQNAGS